MASAESKAEIEFRACTDDDLKDWGRLCGEAFGHKPGRPERFLEKYIEDPDKDLKGVRIAVADGKTVGSVRVIRRSLVVDGKAVPIGGIGEVCTDPAYRGKGIATKLLTAAIEYMDSLGLPLSVLHAGVGAAPIYRKFGFEHIGSIAYGTLDVSDAAEVSEDERVPPGIEIEHLKDYSTAAPALVELFNDYNESLDGYTARSESYWSSYLKYLDWGHRVVARGTEGDRPILATLAIVRSKPGAKFPFRVTDYAATKEWRTGTQGLAMLKALIRSALETPPGQVAPPFKDIQPGTASAPSEAKEDPALPCTVVVLDEVLKRVGRGNPNPDLQDTDWMIRCVNIAGFIG